MEEFNANEFFGNKELPQEVQELTLKVETIENQLLTLKKIESEYEEIKKQLYDKMLEYGVKSWDLPSGTKITLVYPTEEKRELVYVFDEEQFRLSEPALYKKFSTQQEKVTKGRKGYIKVKVA